MIFNLKERGIWTEGTFRIIAYLSKRFSLNSHDNFEPLDRIHNLLETRRKVKTMLKVNRDLAAVNIPKNKTNAICSDKFLATIIATTGYQQTYCKVIAEGTTERDINLKNNASRVSK